MRQELEEIVRYIHSYTPTEAEYIQLAEEATELAHAALKVARALRRESPTPVSVVDAMNDAAEEYSDVITVALVTGIQPESKLIANKLMRWASRIEAAEEGKR